MGIDFYANQAELHPTGKSVFHCSINAYYFSLPYYAGVAGHPGLFHML
jgi:hypothetical protein